MKNFIMTFGQQYRHTQHPYGKQVHPDGWVTIIAPDYDVAFEKAMNTFGTQWAFLYSEGQSNFDKTLFPKGELFVIQA